MEQPLNISSTFSELSLIYNAPIQFEFNGRRLIEFQIPSVGDSLFDLNFKKFMGLISLTPEKIKEQNIKFGFQTDTKGDIIQGLIYIEKYVNELTNYLLKYIKDSTYENKAIYVNKEKIMSYEYEYIAEKLLIGLGQKEFIKEEKKEEVTNPIMAKILEKQKEAEEKLKKTKAKKPGGNLTVEQIVLAICYEFGIMPNEIIKLNYFGIVWYFGYVGKVDAHKLNHQILGSGMSKQKNYSYWLNK